MGKLLTSHRGFALFPGLVLIEDDPLLDCDGIGPGKLTGADGAGAFEMFCNGATGA